MCIAAFGRLIYLVEVLLRKDCEMAKKIIGWTVVTAIAIVVFRLLGHEIVWGSYFLGLVVANLNSIVTYVLGDKS